MQDSIFRKTPLAASVALALGAASISTTYAQDQTDPDVDVVSEDSLMMEEVVVTAIRRSLISSMDVKRDSSGVVDAISAEDIGKFPDQNLAEALQRITGVSIDRSNNEGSQITVRGMGPEFNLVLLNGRSMPTAGSRSFDFADLATEGVRAVEIYKTGKVDLPSGGIGATVNIKTARPLQKPGFQSVLSAKAVHETSSSDSSIGGLNEITPEIAGMFSNTFADDRFGVLVSASYQERDNREENAAVDNWGQSLQLNGGNVNNNNQRADGVWWHPQNIGYGFGETHRERTNAQLVLEFAPSERFTAALDYTYSEVDTEKDSNSVGIWFECPNIDATVNERGTVTQVTQACGDVATNVAFDHNIKENDSLGLNLEWQATDSLSFNFDAHTSTSELRGGGIGDEPGNSANLIIGNTSCDWCGDVDGAGPFTATIASQTATYPANGIPTFDVSFRSTGPDGGPLSALRPQDIGSLFGQAFDQELKNDIDQFQIGGTWDNLDGDGITRLDFGFTHTKNEFQTRRANSFLPAGFWLTSAQYWPDDQWQTGSLDGVLGGFSNGGDFSFDTYYTAPFDYIVDTYEQIGLGDPVQDVYWPGWGAEFTDASGSRGRFWSGALGSGGAAIVEEEVNAFYVQATFAAMFNSMPFNATLGVRYDDTDMTSFGREVPATAVVWRAGNEFSYEFADSPSLREGNGENEFWLPALDMSLDVKEDLIARFSYSRTLARPPIGALTPNRTFEGNPNVRSRRVSAGNPELLPYVSDNFDLSLEWYYAEGSYASAGYFRKRVDNFLVSTIVQETFEGLTDPYIGALAEQARAELNAEGIQADDQAVFARINEILGVPATTPVRPQPGDPLVVFDVTTTENAEIGNLFGWELAIQHMFGSSGWGVQANATFVHGDVDANRDVIGQEFALPGLSDSANLTVFYENDWLSARLAYNWRDEFLSGFDGFGSPVFTEAYAPVDLNVTWYATDQLAFFFEAINITEEVQRSFVRYPEQFLRGNEYGARFNFGARYNF